jgi:hypothetical protein
MTPKEKKLIAVLMQKAADEFNNIGCNDYEKPADWTQEEWDQLSKDMYAANGDPENFEPGHHILMDWWLMSYLGEKLLKDADPLADQLRIAAEAEAEALRKHIVRLEAEIDLLTKQRNDAEQADELEANRADEWEARCHELEAALKAMSEIAMKVVKK